jgi:hypothetical protein
MHPFRKAISALEESCPKTSRNYAFKMHIIPILTSKVFIIDQCYEKYAHSSLFDVGDRKGGDITYVKCEIHGGILDKGESNSCGSGSHLMPARLFRVCGF